MVKVKVIIFTLFAGFALFAGYVFSQWTNYHNFDGICLDCHLVEPAPGDGPGTLIADESELCLDCHESAREFSHPVDMVPVSAIVPSSFLLDWKGMVTCVTCHPAHQQGYGPYRLRVDAIGERFCVMCHSDIEEELHKVSIGSAHIGSTLSTGLNIGEFGTVLDDLSIKCLACHDGEFGVDSLSGNTAITSDSGIIHNIQAIGLTHPIGMNYFEMKRKYRGALRGVNELPSGIKLFAGVVGCGTCHNPYSHVDQELSMSNEGSALCLGCHVK